MENVNPVKRTKKIIVEAHALILSTFLRVNILKNRNKKKMIPKIPKKPAK